VTAFSASTEDHRVEDAFVASRSTLRNFQADADD
jgi:hypothetical protein